MLSLLTRIWWTYRADEAFGFSAVYHWFNVGEGIAWCAIAGLVLRRYVIRHKSPLEMLYALALVTFGASDFYEARVLTTWLILAKGVNLGFLFLLRSHLLRHHYPESKTY